MSGFKARDEAMKLIDQFNDQPEGWRVTFGEKDEQLVEGTPTNMCYRQHQSGDAVDYFVVEVIFPDGPLEIKVQLTPSCRESVLKESGLWIVMAYEGVALVQPPIPVGVIPPDTRHVHGAPIF